MSSIKGKLWHQILPTNLLLQSPVCLLTIVINGLVWALGHTQNTHIHGRILLPNGQNVLSVLNARRTDCSEQKVVKNVAAEAERFAWTNDKVNQNNWKRLCMCNYRIEYLFHQNQFYMKRIMVKGFCCWNYKPTVSVTNKIVVNLYEWQVPSQVFLMCSKGKVSKKFWENFDLFVT